MEKKKIIIVGASSGIGEAVARIYAASGHTVGITGRRGDLLDRIREDYPDRIVVSAFDVTKKDALIRLEELIDRMGGTDLFLLSAGIGYLNLELDYTKEKKIVDVNVSAFTRIVDHMYHYFARQKGGGRLAAISSVAAFRGLDACPAYSASKAYEFNYLEALRKKSHKDQSAVRITVITPGFVDTALAIGIPRNLAAPAVKAATQIISGIERGKSHIYVTRRWRYVSLIMKILPDFIYDRIY